MLVCHQHRFALSTTTNSHFCLDLEAAHAETQLAGMCFAHSWHLLGTCSCGRACVMGSWHRSGDSTALWDMGQPGQLQPSLASSLGTPARLGCQTALGVAE